MNMKITIALLLVGTSVVSGLRCWACQNARSVRECNQKGTTQRCLGQSSKMSCQTEVRFHEGWGGSPLITTGCKETTACASNRKQNKGLAWMRTQCNPQKRNSVCRCCCKGFRCNRRNLLCRQRTLSNKVNLEVRNGRRSDQPRAVSKLNEFRVEGAAQFGNGISVSVKVPKGK